MPPHRGPRPIHARRFAPPRAAGRLVDESVDDSTIGHGDAEQGGERLQKVLAAAGVGSRRLCEQLIQSGRVEVDRKVAATLGTRVEPDRQEIRLDGEVLNVQRKVYYLVNKPMGVVSTSDDPAGRPRVLDLVPERKARLFTVGRLDLSSEGLMLVTNDGELAQRLAHPRYGVEKTYEVLVAGVPTLETIQKLREGVRLAEAFVRPKSLRIRQTKKHSALVEIVLAEGQNREIRRMLARAGHKVLALKRISLGPLKLGALEPGETRRLRGDEIRQLKDAGRGPRVRPFAAKRTQRTGRRQAKKQNGLLSG